MNSKKVLASFSSLMLAFGPMSVYAYNSVVATNADGTTSYADYNSAWNAAQNGVEIIMKSDWDLSDRLILSNGHEAKINMNGHAIKRSLDSGIDDGEVIYVDENASLTLTGSEEDSTFKIKYYNEDQDLDFKSGGIVMGGYSTSGAGGIVMEKGSTLTLNDVDIVNNRAADGDGGGIGIDGDDCTINLNSNSRICYNQATDEGGGIYVDGESAYINVDASEISSNVAAYGGGIESNDDATRITLDNNSTISNNQANVDGGGVYFYEPYGLIKSNDKTGKISSNFAGIYNYQPKGGGVYFESDAFQTNTAAIENITFEDNTVNINQYGMGGAIYANLNNVEITNCTFKNNKAYNGGALYCNSTVYLSGSQIKENHANSNGGGVYVDSGYDLHVSGKMIINDNTKEHKQKSNVYLESGTFSNAYISGTPDDGSKIYVQGDDTIAIDQTSNNGTILLEDADSYHTTYEDGQLLKKEGATGSIFGNGNTLIAGCVMLGIIVIGVGALFIYKKKESQ